MISIFTVPKAFTTDHDTDNQENAFESWAALRPRPEIILLGSEAYVEQQSSWLGFKHVPDIEVNDFGTPLLPSVLAAGEAAATHDLVMYINADIILPPDFMITVSRLLSYEKPFAVGCRWDLKNYISEADTDMHGWPARLLERSTKHAPSGIDYFIYRKGTLGEIPDFALGRWVWDNWMMWNAHQRGLQTIDLTDALKVFHPQHGYTHVQGGFQAGPEWHRNQVLGLGKMLNSDHAREKMEPFRVSIFGLGKLGAPMLACFASEGIKAYGVDPEEKAWLNVFHGLAPEGVVEPGLDAMLTKNHRNIRSGPAHWPPELFFSGQDSVRTASQAVAETHASFVIVPTPSQDDGFFSLDTVIEAVGEIAEALREKDEYHLVVITSTINPGDMQVVRGALEGISGKRCGPDFGLCYSPEFIALGSVIHDWLNPDYVLIGESDQRAGNMLEAIYATVCHNDPPAVRMNWVNAEIAKIAQNAAIVTKIEFANQLMRLCHAIPGANVDEVTRALGSDSRIGPKYLKGGLAPGGPCFPRDCRALVRAGRENGVYLELINTAQNAIQFDKQWLYEQIKELIPIQEWVVGIVGMAYKPGTPVVTESSAMHLAMLLEEDGHSICIYDPMIKAVTNTPWTLRQVCDESDIIVLMSSDETLAYDVHHKLQGTTKLLVDPWRTLLYERHDYRYYPLGASLTKE